MKNLWNRCKWWLGWIVAALLAIVGATAMWKRKQTVRKAQKAFEARKKQLQAERAAAIGNRELDKKVADARSRGTLADRFNE